MNSIDTALPREFYCDPTLPRDSKESCKYCNKGDVVYGIMFIGCKLVKVYGCKVCKARYHKVSP